MLGKQMDVSAIFTKWQIRSFDHPRREMYMYHQSPIDLDSEHVLRKIRLYILL